MFSPSRLSCSSAGQQKSSVPCPASARPRDEASNPLRGTTRFPPPETPVRLSNAVTGRTVLYYWGKPFVQAARERTSADDRAEALSAGEASLFAVVRSAYSLRRCVSSIQVHNRDSSYHISPPFASLRLIFWQFRRKILVSGLQSAARRVIVDATFTERKVRPDGLERLRFL